MSKNKKFSPIILIPIFVAIFVLIVLAVSGHLTRTEDIKEPTAETSVSAVNEQNSEPVSEIQMERLHFALSAIILFIIH